MWLGEARRRILGYVVRNSRVGVWRTLLIRLGRELRSILVCCGDIARDCAKSLTSKRAVRKLQTVSVNMGVISGEFRHSNAVTRFVKRFV